jgi:hypothetical protein
VIAIEHEDDQGSGRPESLLAGIEQAGAFLRQVMERRDGAGVLKERETH